MFYKSYNEWIRKSNEAGVFREAFDLNDQMPIEHNLRIKCFEIIFRASEQSWNEYKKEDKS